MKTLKSGDKNSKEFEWTIEKSMCKKVNTSIFPELETVSRCWLKPVATCVNYNSVKCKLWKSLLPILMSPSHITAKVLSLHEKFPIKLLITKSHQPSLFLFKWVTLAGRAIHFLSSTQSQIESWVLNQHLLPTTHESWAQTAFPSGKIHMN
jgi:hypothetical protein